MRKGSIFLFFNGYGAYEKFEVDFAENTYEYKMSGIKNLFSNHAYEYDEGEVVFDDFYRIYPEGWQNTGELRTVRCGKVTEKNERILNQGVGNEDYKYQILKDGYAYVVIDTEATGGENDE